MTTKATLIQQQQTYNWKRPPTEEFLKSRPFYIDRHVGAKPAVISRPLNQ